MTLYELTKQYSSGKGEDAMWKTVEVVSRAVEESMPEKEKHRLLRKIYSTITDRHYNEQFAYEDIEKMYYTDKNDKLHNAPYWQEEDMRDLYENYKDEIPDYNFWDFAVALNMVASDSWVMIKGWFPDLSPEELNEKFAEMAVNFLDDKNRPSTTKIWDYFSE